MNNSDCKQIVFSDKAYVDLTSEVYEYISIETGGIFLGTICDNIWYVVEVIDPGYDKIIRKKSYFEYDHNYVNHIKKIKSRRYRKKLDILGLWHRHPSSMDTFSETDDETNKKFAQLNAKGTISAIVNLDPKFRLTLYHLKNGVSNFKRPLYEKLVDIKIGNKYIPNKFLQIKPYNKIIDQQFQNEKELDHQYELTFINIKIYIKSIRYRLFRLNITKIAIILTKELNDTTTYLANIYKRRGE